MSRAADENRVVCATATPLKHRRCRKKCGRRAPILPNGLCTTICERCADLAVLQTWKSMERTFRQPIVYWAESAPKAKPEIVKLPIKSPPVAPPLTTAPRLRTAVTQLAQEDEDYETYEPLIETGEPLPDISGMNRPAMQLALAGAAQRGCLRAIPPLLKSIEGLVHQLARRSLYAIRRADPSREDVEDVMASANILLMRKLHVFDPSSGSGFVTWAMWWIRHACQRAVQDDATIRVPVHVHDAKTKLFLTARRLERELGREPTDEELSAATEIKVSKIRKVKDIQNGTVSIDAPLADGDKRTRLDAMPDSAPDQLDLLSSKLTRRQVEELLATLTPKEQLVIRDRFGIAEDEREVTLREIGDKLGVTRERIRQIEQKAMLKLRRRVREFDLT